jgi:hypothetical protein
MKEKFMLKAQFVSATGGRRLKYRTEPRPLSGGSTRW